MDLLLAALLFSFGADAAPVVFNDEKKPTKDESSVEGGRVSPDGKEEIAIDLPNKEHMKNAEGRDGLGLCVFTSVEMAGRWQNSEKIWGFQARMKNEDGGGWPGKLERMMEKHCAGAAYLQYEGNDPALMRLAIDTGRMPAVTYGFSPRYGGRVAHMVNLVHLSDSWAAVLDNNFPGDHRYEWMKPGEFTRRWTMGGGGWAVFLLSPPPPPVPRNRKFEELSFGQRYRPGKECWGQSPMPSVDGYSWEQIIEKPEQWALMQAGKQIGVYDATREKFFRLLPDSKWKEEKVPFEIPEILRKKTQPKTKNYGVDEERISRVEKFLFNGAEISRDQARKLLVANPGGKLEDDREKLRVTVIGGKEDCAKVAADIAGDPAFEGWRERVLVQCYRPTDWAVADFGFPPGQPRIVVQSGPDATGRGKVIHSQGDYAGGAKALADALRKAKPDYDPKRDPDRRKDSDPVGDAGGARWLSLICAVVAGALAVRGMPLLAAGVRAIPALIPARAPAAPAVAPELLALLADMQARLAKMEPPPAQTQTTTTTTSTGEKK